MDMSPAEFLADIEVAVTDRMPDPRRVDEHDPYQADADLRAERERLQATVDAANGAPERLTVAFSDLVDRLGHKRASQLWLAVFGAQDAAETG